VTYRVKTTAIEDVFARGGETGTLMGKIDWAATPVGPAEIWPPGLQGVLRSCLASLQPTIIWWGNDRVVFYNDAASARLGPSWHPQAMGKLGRNCHSDWWCQIEPMLNRVWDTGQTICSHEQFLIEADNRLEERYFNFLYSPIFNPFGEIEGVLTTATETTLEVLQARRMQMLQDLMVQTGQAETIKQVCQGALQALATNVADIPFVLLYLLDSRGHQLVQSGNLPSEVAIALSSVVDLTQPDIRAIDWPLASTIRTGSTVLIDNLADLFTAMPLGVWRVPPQQALVLPLRIAGQKRPLGLMVAGVNPCRAFDSSYRILLEMTAGQIATAIANVQMCSEDVQHSVQPSVQLEVKPELLNGDVTSLTPGLAAGHSLRPIPSSSVSTAYLLVVDDKVEMRDYLTRLLSPIYDIDVVAHASEVLAATRRQVPDLILMEGMLSEVSSFSLLRELRSAQHTRKVPIILLSVVTGEELCIKGLEAGADDYLIRPFSPRELLARIEANLKVARLWQEAAQQEQRLRTETEAAYRQIHKILESIADAFIATNHQWQFTYVNREAERLLNRTWEELLGKPLWEGFPNGMGSVFYREFHRAIADHVTVEFEAFYEPSDRWLEVWAYPFADGLAIYFRDVTDRKRTAQALRESEDRLRLALDFTQIGAWDWDIATGTLIWNENHYHLFDLRPGTDQPTYDLWTSLMHPDDRQATQDAIARALATRTDFAAEYRILWSDGSLHWIVSKGRGIFDMTGAAVRMLGVALDITERKRAEEQMKFLAEASSVLTASIDYKTTLANIAHLMVPTLADFCYFDVLTVEGKLQRVAQHHADPNKQAWFAEIQTYIPTEDFVEHPVIHVLKTGKTVLIPYVSDGWMQKAATNAGHLQFMRDSRLRSLMTVPLIANTRTLGALTLCFAAESGRHYTTDELTLAEELAHRAALALDNAQLYHQAQEANRVKDEFLAVLSHELRTPLNPILGWTQLLQARQFDQATLSQALSIIERNAKLQTQLIGDLLDISRILRGKLSLDSKPVDLQVIILAAIETMRLSAEAKLIHIYTYFEPDMGPVLGDAGRLQQVIWNLLSNAIKFTPPEGHVEIRLERVWPGRSEWVSEISDEDRGDRGDLYPSSLYSPNTQHLTSNTQHPIPAYARITVTDTGKGIKPEFLPHVFDRFRQADSTITRTFGGLGLGLAIVRYMVELHGGTVRADSPGEDQGATFTVMLPLMRVTETTLEPRSDEAIAPAAPRFLAGTKILVVDDDADARSFIELTLQHHGAKVTTVASAQEALQILVKSKPDVLLSDIAMPEVDGYTLMRQIKSWETYHSQSTKPMAAIALTAYAGEYDQQQAMAAGFQLHLAKPIDSADLLKAIANVLNLA
jgi:PAS domain S-box-containing protein